MAPHLFDSVHQTIGVEMVVSTDEYRALVEGAQAVGFGLEQIAIRWNHLIA